MSVPVLDFRNTNSLWCSVIVETLARLGLRHAVVCPGSRSAPLTFAFARHPQVEAVPVLDERSAGFFALGLVRQHHRPVALLCTSGTAAAGFLPAIIEAHESGVPLLVFTADRPPEMRDCGSGQTIDQQKFYGGYVNYYHELAVPEAKVELLHYVRQNTVCAFERTQFPFGGPVHLNAPFRDPLPPIEDGLAEKLRGLIDPETFFAHVEPALPPPVVESSAGLRPASYLALPDLARFSRGVIVAGPAQPADPKAYCAAVARIAAALGWPVLADGLNPLRNHAAANPLLVINYNAVLRSAVLAERLKPEAVLGLGDWPTSKQLRQWLQGAGVETWIVSADSRNHDPLHGRTRHLRCSVEALANDVTSLSGTGVSSSGTGVSPVIPKDMGGTPMPQQSDMGKLSAAPDQQTSPQGGRERTPYAAEWLRADRAAGLAIDSRLSTIDPAFEGSVSRLLSESLPPGTPIFVANSMPVRDVEFFWKLSDRGCRLLFNRGANGIDGTLSTALGVAHGNKPAVALTGDLALLHDTNGFLLRPKLRGSLTIVLINNRGGGIFEMLLVAKFDPPFEEFFAAPQEVDFARLCSAYGAAHVLVRDRAHLAELISTLPETGLRVLEVRTDRKRDAASRRELIGVAGQAAEDEVRRAKPSLCKL
jgi:2-succinyl-5-enolpyruvyl-6-hydroxy-3-cyclohexene-1-carboxylate synthase